MFNPGRPYGIVGPGVHIDSWSPLCSQPWTSWVLPMEATPHQTQKARGTVHGGHKDQPLGHGNGAEGAAWGFPRSPWHAASSRFLSSGTFLISLLSRMHARTQACTLTHTRAHTLTHSCLSRTFECENVTTRWQEVPRRRPRPVCPRSLKTALPPALGKRGHPSYTRAAL